MSERQHISSGTPWEKSVGYCRAIRVGKLVYVSGTTASDENGNVMAVGDVYGQTAYILKKIERALNEAGASISDVVRTRSFITDISRWEEFGRAHGEVFAEIQPVSTLVQVSQLIDPKHLIEIEVDAVVADSVGEG
ncbi:MAG TPA: RidA family protein [Phototrophicaceae bacterium]|nr:RidA family protein [Phototrophicaceae bacterium]